MMRKSFYIIFIIFIIIVFVFSVNFYYKKNKHIEVDPNTYNEVVLVPKHIESRFAPPGFIHYWNTDYQFSLFYPTTYLVDEYKEDDGSITIVFQDPKDYNGFQVYITPYYTDKITDEQFKKDVPSGVKIGEQKTTLDGVEAVAFKSEDIDLGKTLEVWSIHYGYLYEILTQEGGEEIINNVVSSWKFY